MSLVDTIKKFFCNRRWTGFFQTIPRLGRIDGIALLFLYFILSAYLGLSFFILWIVLAMSGISKLLSYTCLILMCVIIAIGLINQFLLTLRRFHDLNLSGWWSFLLYVPIIIIFDYFHYNIIACISFIPLGIIFCLPGTQVLNRFGPPCKPRLFSYVLIFALLPFLFILGRIYYLLTP
jgi:uncharacterized membrane protein YhaH (DUF805 family)